MKAREGILALLILLPAFAAAGEKPSAPSGDAQKFVYRMSEGDMQKFLRGVRSDPVSPDAFRIARDWEAGRALIRIGMPKTLPGRAPARKSQNRTILDCGDQTDKDMVPVYERNDRCGAIFRVSPFREPPRAD